MAEFKIVIWRKYKELETVGCAMVLEDDKAIFKFNTLELPMFTIPLNLNTVCTNCIPAGTYKTTKRYSPTKGQCFKIHDVEGRTDILIHKGNYAAGRRSDTQGCILVGREVGDINRDGNLDVVRSTETMDILLDILPDEFKIILI